MATAQLRLLAILLLQDNTNAIQQLQIRLVGILLNRADKRIAHGARGLASNCGVGARLVVLAAAPANDIGGARLGAHRLLVRLVAVHGMLAEAHEALEHAADVAARVRHGRAEQARAGLLHQVGLFEDALGGVRVGEIEHGARVARVENARQAHAGLQGCDADGVDFVVDYVAALLEVDGVDGLVVAVVLVAVEVFGLAAVPCWESDGVPLSTWCVSRTKALTRVM